MRRTLLLAAAPAALFLAILVTALSSTEVGAQAGWDVECPAPPSYVRAGVPFDLAATVTPPDASGLTITWTIENVGVFDGAVAEGAMFETAQSEAQTVFLSATDGIETIEGHCRGIAVVEAGAVVIEPLGANLQDEVTAAGPGALIYLDRGTHLGNVNVRLLDDQTIRGFMGSNGTTHLSIIDGTGTQDVFNTRQAAFISNPGDTHPQDVTIADLAFTNYTTWQDATPDEDKGPLTDSGFHGVIHAQSARSSTLYREPVCSAEPRDPDGYGPAIAWTIDNVSITGNRGAGIVLSSGVTVTNSTISANEHIGIGGAFLDTVIVDNVTVEGNALNADVQQNHHAGGIKVTRGQNVHVLNSRFNNNGGPGIWFDIDMHSSRIANNTANGNSTRGIFHEISWAVDIVDNTATNNAWFDIQIAEAGGYEREDGTIVLNVVENNRISDAEISYRYGDRQCNFDSFRAADPNDLLIPSTVPTNFVTQHNEVSNNGPTAPGASATAVPVAPYVPRVDGAPPLLLGDVNCSGAIELLDARLIALYSIDVIDGFSCPDGTPVATSIGDVDASGTTNLLDARYVAQCSIGVANLFCPDI